MSLLPAILREILRKEESIEKRAEHLEKLREIDLPHLESYLFRIIKAIEILEKRTSLGDQQERKLLIKALDVLQTLSIRSPKVSSGVLTFLVNRLKKLDNFLIIDDPLLAKYILALRIPLRNEPWKIFEVLETVRGILLTERFVESRKAVLITLSDVVWNLPYILSDIKNIIMDLLEHDTGENLRPLIIDLLSRVCSRNFFAIKSLIEELVRQNKMDLIFDILKETTYLPLPITHREIAETFFNALFEKLSAVTGKEKLKYIKALFKLVRKTPFADLQDKFLNMVLEKLSEETLAEIRGELLEMLAAVSWHRDIDLGRILDAVTSVLHSPLEEESNRIKAIKVLIGISMHNPSLASNVYRIILDAYDLLKEPNNKMYLIDALNDIINFVRDRSLIIRTATLLINIIQEIGEEEGVRVRAAEFLVVISRHFPDVITELSSSLLSAFRSITEWDIKDALVKVAGEAIKKNASEPDLLEILVEALSDEWIYGAAINYLVVAAYNSPEKLLNKIERMKSFIKTISDVEKEILEEENMEAYYYHIETPKRLFYKILREIANKTHTRLEQILELLLEGSKEETNEIIIRDIAIAIKEIIDIDNTLLEKLTQRDLNPLLIDSLKQFGLNIS
ncbi:MAG: hypothetical protein ACTSUJ_09795 [Candidatus Njordarchaeales archaeon]